MRNLVGLILVVLVFAPGCASVKQKVFGAGDTSAPVMQGGANSESCPVSREFITALEFLRAESAFAIGEKEARDVALEVAKGCKGAAGRFIKSSRLFMKVGLSSRDALRTAIKLAQKSDSEAETFAEVFRSCFVSDLLDLDLDTSFQIATSLSNEFAGDKDTVRGDFKRFVDFCVSDDRLDLPRPKCANLAAGLARQGESIKKPVFKPFVKAYEFLRSSQGPQLRLDEAVDMARELIGYSTESVDTFIQGYKYANSQSGLGLGVRESLDFGKKAASLTKGSREGDQKASESKKPGAV